MILVPYETISYKTKLGNDQITKRIQEIIEPKKTIRLIKGNSKKAYEGIVRESSFNIRRMITFTNLFSPNISGTMVKENDEIRIDLKFKLQAIIIVGMIIWLGYVGFVFFTSLGNLIVHDVSDKNLFTSLAMLVLGYIIMTMAFKSEIGKDKKMLEELLEAETEK